MIPAAAVVTLKYRRAECLGVVIIDIIPTLLAARHRPGRLLDDAGLDQA